MTEKVEKNRGSQDPYYTELAGRLKQIRLHFDVTQRTIAYSIGRNYQWVAAVERCKVKPLPLDIANYARLFPEVDSLWLMTGATDSDKVKLERVPEPGYENFTTRSNPKLPRVKKYSEKRSERTAKERTKKAVDAGEVKVEKPKPPPGPVWRPGAWSGQRDMRPVIETKDDE